MNSIALELGPITIYWYSITMFLAILTATILIVIESKKQKVNKDDLIYLIFYGIICGILGARIYYVLFNLDYYLQDPLETIKIWHGGIAIHGAIIGGLLFLIFFSKKKKLNVLKMMDIIAVGLIIAQAIGRWGNFFNQEAHGVETSLSFLKSLHLPKFIIEGMHINGVYYHPTFLYESIGNVIVFFVLYKLAKNRKFSGQIACGYFIGYAFVRFFVEGLRTDSLMLGPIRVSQALSLLLFIASLCIYIYKSRKTKV
jgi:phosphatidylglycerol:prolipoprotein diacylglycerol transferase